MIETITDQFTWNAIQYTGNSDTRELEAATGHRLGILVKADGTVYANGITRFDTIHKGDWFLYSPLVEAYWVLTDAQYRELRDNGAPCVWQGCHHFFCNEDADGDGSVLKGYCDKPTPATIAPGAGAKGLFRVNTSTGTKTMRNQYLNTMMRGWKQCLAVFHEGELLGVWIDDPVINNQCAADKFYRDAD